MVQPSSAWGAVEGVGVGAWSMEGWGGRARRGLGLCGPENFTAPPPMRTYSTKPPEKFIAILGGVMSFITAASASLPS